MKKNVLRLKFQKGDFLAVGLVLAAAALVFFIFLQKTQEQQNYVQIYQDGVLIRELSLEDNQIFEVIGEYLNVIEIQDRKVSVISSDCPGEDCVHTGAISGAGRSIVCLPNRVEIRIVGESEVDFTVGQKLENQYFQTLKLCRCIYPSDKNAALRLQK